MDFLSELRAELVRNSTEKERISGLRFFKEEVKLLGLKTALVAEIGKDFLQKLEDKSKKNIFSLCEDLFKSGIMEESFVACQWSYTLKRQYKPEDFDVFERWVHKYVNNWATCDTLCNHNVGTIVEMYPELMPRLKQWSESENRWVKRASAVSLIIPARKGKFLKDIFEIADTLLVDPDDMVRKGYGWMLKAASQAHQEEVFSYVIKNKGAMPRTALRYAIEKMPSELKSLAMSKS
ncbi:MAG TPA: DNA alkylation repair protein [Bacteroidales bacterium]|nr:DNA alkylation repair protein [Bacteroidales bacterium]